MADAKRHADALGIYLTGGASNSDPDASLGGVRSTIEARQLGAIISLPVAPVIVESVLGSSGEGEAQIRGDKNGNLYWTAPGEDEGDAIAIADGESKLLLGSDEDKGVRVTRDGTATLLGAMALDLKYIFNGWLAGRDITNAERVAGEDLYRGVMLRAHGDYGVLDTSVWLDAMAGEQATIEIGIEPEDANGDIQVIADEFTAPAAVAFSSPLTKGAGLKPGTIDVGHNHGLWVHKQFPAVGSVATEENVILYIAYWGA